MFINFYDHTRECKIDLNVARINYVRPCIRRDDVDNTVYLIDIDEANFAISEADYERCIVPLRFIEQRPYRPTAAAADATAAYSTKSTVDEIIDDEEREFHATLDEHIDIFGDIAGDDEDEDEEEEEEEFDYESLDDDDDDDPFEFTAAAAKMLMERIDTMLPSVREAEKREAARIVHYDKEREATRNMGGVNPQNLPELRYVTDEGGA